MASFILKIFVFLTVTISITTKTRFNVAANEFISTICPKTKYPALCNRILRSNPEAQQANSLRRLGEICMNLGIGHARDVVNELNEVLTRGDLPEKRKYTTCRNDYIHARWHMIEAKNRFMSNELEKAMDHAGVAARTPSACGMQFARGREPKILARINDKADAIFSMPVTIAREIHRAGGN